MPGGLRAKNFLFFKNIDIQTDQFRQFSMTELMSQDMIEVVYNVYECFYGHNNAQMFSRSPL